MRSSRHALAHGGPLRRRALAIGGIRDGNLPIVSEMKGDAEWPLAAKDDKAIGSLGEWGIQTVGL
jgi:hypothetical protein